ncbi:MULTISPECIES: curli production assembly/transport protein CsgE [unclassified Colwellia]|uniref:curli production assembly/transport protein CsgE n=1 Tax=unclassified Colwellia TaxID=196834 RepID=UPI002175327F|nr:MULTISPECIES: curli production assembly/transport protein CsgE [unclassified Colwellia]
MSHYMSKYICLCIMVTLSLLSTPMSYATNEVEEVEIGGLLLDNTKSRSGHDFYFQFSQLWRDIPNTQGINAQLIEQIVPMAGTKLSLLLNGRIIYVTYFGRRQSPVKDKVEQAIFILIDAMAETQYNQNSIDMAGSGW